MTRIVDRVQRGSNTASSSLSSAAIANSTIMPFAWGDEVSVAILFNKKIQNDAYWGSFPSIGLSKLNTGVSGFNMQFSGNSGISKGAPYLRVDADSVAYANTPSTQSGVMRGCHVGWMLYLCTINRGVSRIYVNGRPESERIYPHGTGFDTTVVPATHNSGHAAGYGGSIHPRAVGDIAIWDAALTPQEIHDYWFANKFPNRGARIFYNFDNKLAGTITPNQAVDTSLSLNTLSNGLRSSETFS